MDLESKKKFSIDTPQAEFKFDESLSNIRGIDTISSDNKLLSLKLLRDLMPANSQDQKNYDELIKAETFFMNKAVALLKKDVDLSHRMGGFSAESALKLADVLKRKHMEAEVNARIGDIVSTMITEQKTNEASRRAGN